MVQDRMMIVACVIISSHCHSVTFHMVRCLPTWAEISHDALYRGISSYPGVSAKTKLHRTFAVLAVSMSRAVWNFGFLTQTKQMNVRPSKGAVSACNACAGNFGARDRTLCDESNE